MAIDHVDRNRNRRIAAAIIGIYYYMMMKFLMAYYIVALVIVIRRRRRSMPRMISEEEIITSTAGTSKRMKGASRQNRTWGPVEDAKLVECLLDLVNTGHWKGDKGIFRSGYLGQLEKLMEEKLPGCGLKASPHIESRVKLLKRQYNAIQKMLGPHASGFGWNDKDKCITCEENVFNDWIKSHPYAKGLRNKPFPHLDKLVVVFGRGKAIGEAVEVPTDGVKKMEGEEEIANATNFVNEEMADVGLENVQENCVGSASDTQSPSSIQLSQAASPSSRQRKPKRLRDNTDDDPLVKVLSDELSKMRSYFQMVGEHIKQLAGAFNVEREMRMKVFPEILKIEGLTQNERMMVGKKISGDALETDYFFSLPEDYRRAYVFAMLHRD